VSHLSSDLLRRYIDEPHALLTYEKEHLVSCPRCRARLESARGHARFAGALRFDQLSVTRRVSVARILGAIAAAAVVALVIAYTPLRTYAQNFLTIFQPRAFHGVALTRADVTTLQGLPDLQAFGTMRQSSRARFSDYPDAAAASRHAHMTIVVPGYLPAAVPRKAMFHVRIFPAASFTFSAAKARTVGEHSGKAIPLMPAKLDGATLVATVGPAVLQTYGAKSAWETALRRAQPNKSPLPGHQIRSDGLRALPTDTIIITQTRAPKVTSSGATVAQIESYLLSLPGVPTDLAEQIRAIGDPTSTVPVPFRIDKESAQTIDVLGSPALLIGDNTGIGSGVIWQRGGIVYGVAGPFAASEILRVANSLSP